MAHLRTIYRNSWAGLLELTYTYFDFYVFREASGGSDPGLRLLIELMRKYPLKEFAEVPSRGV